MGTKWKFTKNTTVNSWSCVETYTYFKSSYILTSILSNQSGIFRLNILDEKNRIFMSPDNQLFKILNKVVPILFWNVKFSSFLIFLLKKSSPWPHRMMLLLAMMWQCWSWRSRCLPSRLPTGSVGHSSPSPTTWARWPLLPAGAAY